MLLTEYLYKYSLIRVMSTYSGWYFPVIVSLIGYTVIGFLISIKTFYIEYQKEGKWVFDKVKIFLLFIPSLILAFIPLEYISMISDFDN